MEVYARMQWRGKFEFLFTTFGYTIGLGNIWRFPYTCYRNGGGAFLLPYFLTIIFCTLPMVFLEMCMGQFSSEGPIKVWSISPLFQGIGWANMFILFITNTYYITIIMYAMYFMLVAFVNIGSVLPWQQCRINEWGTEFCEDQPSPNTALMTRQDIIQLHIGNMKETCVGNVLEQRNITMSSVLSMAVGEFNNLFSRCVPEVHSPEEEYWNRFVLEVHEAGGTHDLGPLVARNVVLLITAWLIVYYCCIRGIRSIARVIYVTATFPFGLILILLVRGMTLSGYEKGIQYYTQPEWGKLADLKIWSSAATQAIYSIGIAFGSHIALASHNKFKTNIFRDSIIITSINTLTSILIGFVVFAFLGHAAERLNKNIEELFDQGPGILFISYAQGLSQLPGATVWATLFYLTVFTLGLDSQLVMVWTMASSLQDVFPKTFKRFEKLGLLGLCLVMLLLGLPLVTKGGMHLIVLMDAYLANFSLTLFVLLESVVVCWVYGLNNFVRDIEMMIGTQSPYFWIYWKITWIVCAPVFSIVSGFKGDVVCELTPDIGSRTESDHNSSSGAYVQFVFIASIITYGPSSYNGIVINAGGEAIGWLIIITPLIIFSAVAAFQIRRFRGIKAATQPTVNWRPANDDNCEGWYAQASPRDFTTAVNERCANDYITPIHVAGDITNENGGNDDYDKLAHEDYI